MKKVSVKPGCISCGSCVFYAPEVFDIEVTSFVKPEAQLEEHATAIKKAALSCPVAVITYQE